jgi:hypothetical protein
MFHRMKWARLMVAALVGVAAAQASALHAQTTKPASPASKPENGDAQPKAAKFPNEATIAPLVNGVQEVRDALNQGYSELARAIRSLNPSYAIAPVVGRSAATGGSFYIRGQVSVVPYQLSYSPGVVPAVATVPAARYRWVQTGSATPYAVPISVALPPPVVLGGSSYQLPWWLYTGTVDLNVAVPVAAPVAVVPATDEVRALREELRKLREQVEKLQQLNR